MVGALFRFLKVSMFGTAFKRAQSVFWQPKMHFDDIWQINLEILMGHWYTFLYKHLALLCRLAGGTIKAKMKILQQEECLVYLALGAWFGPLICRFKENSITSSSHLLCSDMKFFSRILIFTLFYDHSKNFRMFRAKWHYINHL